MKPWNIAGAAAVAAALLGCAGCASSPDRRPLTPAEKEQLMREYQSTELRRDLGLDGSGRAGCSTSTGTSRAEAREGRFQGPDSFDARGCHDALPRGAGAPAPDKNDKK